MNLDQPGFGTMVNIIDQMFIVKQENIVAINITCVLVKPVKIKTVHTGVNQYRSKSCYIFLSRKITEAHLKG
jgi:hypothetical protein